MPRPSDAVFPLFRKTISNPEKSVSIFHGQHAQLLSAESTQRYGFAALYHIPTKKIVLAL
jgi:hypothetical protein